MQRMSRDLIIHSPRHGAPKQLFLLFHGSGATPNSLQPVGERLAEIFTEAAVIAVCAPNPASTHAFGFEWFSNLDISEANRAARVDAAMPAFVAAVQRWQREINIDAASTALLGFSEGAIMALESTQRDGAPTLAGRVISIAGRFARHALAPSADIVLHLFHGREDPVTPYQHTVAAAEALVAQDADLTADIFPHVGHGMNEDMLATLLHRLQTHVPKRLWDEAMSAARLH
jgi:phospholipase/carboxylesterase